MLMEQEAPLLFHTVFAGAVILTVAYLLHWRGHSPQKKPLELILYFVLLQIPAYILPPSLAPAEQFTLSSGISSAPARSIADSSVSSV